MTEQTSGGEQLSGAARKVGEEIQSDVQSLKDIGQKRATDELDNRKGEVSAIARSASSAIKTAAYQMNEDSPQWLITGFKQVAEKVSDLAEALENKSTAEIGRQTHEFARNNPGTFMAASAATGFALARLLRAGAAYGVSDDLGSDPVATASPTAPTPGAGEAYSPSAGLEGETDSLGSGTTR